MIQYLVILQKVRPICLKTIYFVGRKCAIDHIDILDPLEPIKRPELVQRYIVFALKFFFLFVCFCLFLKRLECLLFDLL